MDSDDAAKTPISSEESEVPTIGTRIRDARLALNKSRAWLANELRVSENAIKAIEDSTTKSPSFTNGLRIADALGVDPRALAFGEEAAKPPAIASGVEDPESRLVVLESSIEELTEDLRNLNERLAPLFDEASKRRAAEGDHPGTERPRGKRSRPNKEDLA